MSTIFDFQTGTNTEIIKGSFFTKVLTYKFQGTAINISSFTFEMVIKDVLGGTTLLTLAQVASDTLLGLYIPDPTTSVINIQIPISDSDGLTVGTPVYEFTMTDSSGRLFEFFQGTIQVTDRGF